MSSSVPNAFSASSDTFSINVKKRGDLIITNRNQLYHHHSSNVDAVNEMLKYMVRIAGRRDAVIFYADWWDEYDDFATLDGQTLNPTGNPIKDWDRTSLDYANNSEAILNNVANVIDNYTHYWADQLGGKKKDHYLLIVGGDKVIPFLRIQDPTGDAAASYSTWYGITDELLRAATANYIFTDAKYADTNGKKWETGKVDNMYVGRVLGQDAANTLKFLENIWDDMVSPPENDNVIVSLITDDFGKLDLPNEMFGEEVGYVVIDEYDGKSLTDDSWGFNDIAKALRDGTDYWVFYGHGNSSGGGTHNALLFRGNDFNGTVTDSDGNQENVSDLFQRYYPHLIMMACGMGIADSGNNGVVPTDAMTYSAIRNNVAHYIGATTITDDNFNKSFVKRYIRQTTGGDDFGFNENPERLGFALNKAKNNVGKGGFFSADNGWTLSHLGYILYGTPWRLITPPSERTRQALRAERQIPAQSISGAEGVLTKTLSETISTYQILTEKGFDFVSIEGYKQLEVGKQTIPVVPVKRLEIVVPDGANVSVVRSEPEDLGVLNIPVYNSFPPIITEPPQPKPEPYVAALAGIVFDRVYYSEELNEGENIILLDLFPVYYDAATKQATLYKRFEINITYEGTIKGVLLDAKSEKDGYALGETVVVNVAVENVTDKTQDYNATVSVEDDVGNTVQTQTEVLTVNPASIGERLIQLQPFTAGGGYWIETLVTDGVSEIGTSEQHINVDSGYIIELQAPQGFTGSVLQLTVIFQNTSNRPVDSVFKVNIYQGDTKVAEFIPVTYNIAVGAIEEAIFNWEIPVDFPIGQYKAVATVQTDTHSAITSKNFVIEPPQQPDKYCTSSECNYSLMLDSNGFYVVVATLPKTQKEGVWSLLVNPPSVLYVGGFHGGAVLKENGDMPSWVAFSLSKAEPIQITAHDYSGNGLPFSFQIDQEIAQGNRRFIHGPVSIAPGETYTTPTLAPGLYIVGVLSQPGSPRGRFGLSINGQNLFGGVVGGWIDSSTKLGGEGFAAFNVAFPQQVDLKVFFGDNYAIIGAGRPQLDVYYLKDDGSFVPYWTTPR